MMSLANQRPLRVDSVDWIQYLAGCRSLILLPPRSSGQPQAPKFRRSQANTRSIGHHWCAQPWCCSNLRGIFVAHDPMAALSKNEGQWLGRTAACCQWDLPCRFIASKTPRFPLRRCDKVISVCLLLGRSKLSEPSGNSFCICKKHKHLWGKSRGMHSAPKEFDWIAQLRYYWRQKGSITLKARDFEFGFRCLASFGSPLLTLHIPCVNSFCTYVLIY